MCGYWERSDRSSGVNLSYELIDLRVHSSGAYQWTVVGLYSARRKPAHFTVYFPSARGRAGVSTRCLDDFRTRDPCITLCGVYGPRSWLVDYNGPYLNDRPPHVECTLSSEYRRAIYSMQTRNS